MMKTRLYGLLALVLCAMMVAAPVAAMGAAQYNALSSNSNIAAGDIVYSNDSGISFTITSTEFKMKYTYLDSTTAFQDANDTFFSTGINPWQIVSVGTEAASLAQVKVLFKEQLPANANQALNITAYLIGTELGSQYPSAEAAKASLKDALRGYKNIDYYYMKVYECLYKENGYGEIYRPIANPGETLITLDYPSSYSEATPKLDDFCLAHLNGDGTVELISASALTDKGIQFKVSSFSPFALGYQRNDAGTSPDGGTIIPGGPGDRIPAPADPAAPSIPQTGDNSQLALWFALAALSLAGAVLALRRRKA